MDKYKVCDPQVVERGTRTFSVKPVTSLARILGLLGFTVSPCSMSPLNTVSWKQKPNLNFDRDQKKSEPQKTNPPFARLSRLYSQIALHRQQTSQTDTSADMYETTSFRSLMWVCHITGTPGCSIALCSVPLHYTQARFFYADCRGHDLHNLRKTVRSPSAVAAAPPLQQKLREGTCAVPGPQQCPHPPHRGHPGQSG